MAGAIGRALEWLFGEAPSNEKAPDVPSAYIANVEARARVEAQRDATGRTWVEQCERLEDPEEVSWSIFGAGYGITTQTVLGDKEGELRVTTGDHGRKIVTGRGPTLQAAVQTACELLDEVEAEEGKRPAQDSTETREAYKQRVMG